MICRYPERRISTPAERQQWKDSHPRGVITVGLIALCLATFCQALYAASPTPFEALAVLRDTSYIVFGATAAIYVGQRLIVFLVNHLILRMEKVNALPERVDQFETFIKNQFDILRTELINHNKLQEGQFEAIERRLELLEGK